MWYTVKALADLVGGLALGQAERQVSEITSIDNAGDSGISPFFQKKLLGRATVLPGAVLAPPALARHALERGVAAALAHKQPALALAGLIDLFHPEKERPGQIHATACVHPTAEVHPSALIEPMAVVEARVKVGRQSVVGPGAVIREGCAIGRYVRIGPGAVIGAEGFGVVEMNGRLVKVRHVGNVVVDDYVDIGANTCIDRGTLGTTFVGRGAKIDNQVQVGHNTRIGRQVIMAAQVGVAGSTVIGDNVMIGGQAGIKDHVEIGAGAKVAGGCGVTRDVAPGEVVAGFPTLPRITWLRAMARLKHLGQIPKPGPK